MSTERQLRACLRNKQGPCVLTCHPTTCLRHAGMVANTKQQAETQPRNARGIHPGCCSAPRFSTALTCRQAVSGAPAACAPRPMPLPATQWMPSTACGHPLHPSAPPCAPPARFRPRAGAPRQPMGGRRCGAGWAGPGRVLPEGPAGSPVGTVAAAGAVLSSCRTTPSTPSGPASTSSCAQGPPSLAALASMHDVGAASGG